MIKLISARQSVLTALVIIVVLTVWMFSGRHTSTDANPVGAESAEIPRTPTVSVRVRTLDAEPVQRELVLRGTTEPARTVTLRAEIDGRVVEIGAERGAQVREGDVIARIDPRDRHALMVHAKATIEQRELQYQAAQKLSQQSFQSQTEVARAIAELEAARAELEKIEVELGNTTIRASFDGVLDHRSVEVGDYLSAGDEVARVLEQDPILVVGYAAQQRVDRIVVGSPGTAVLVTGQAISGTVRYVAAESDDVTRTFRVELEVDNPGHTVTAGLTGEMRIPTSRFVAHFLPSSLLSLGASDQLGIKAVNERSTVEFHPVEIIRSTSTGLWVIGLPERVRVITVGQGFVRAGDTVRPVDEGSIETTSDTATDIDRNGVDAES